MSFVIQDSNTGEKMIKNLFQNQTRSQLNSAVNKGYQLAGHTLENTNYLNYSKSRGKDILPYLKNFAVEFSIIKYIEQGLLPFDYEIKYNRNKSARYFVLFDASKKIELCINQVDNIKKIGRPAYYRDKRILSFNSYIDFDEFKDPEIITDKPIYFELNHGYQSLIPYFVILGIPGNNGKWIDKVDISKELNLISNPNTIQTKEENIDFNFEKLQEYIEESEKNG